MIPNAVMFPGDSRDAEPAVFPESRVRGMGRWIRRLRGGDRHMVSCRWVSWQATLPRRALPSSARGIRALDESIEPDPICRVGRCRIRPSPPGS
jgi:hypothetical protein